MNRAAVFTVIYAGVEPWLSQFISSVAGQTDGCFDLVMVNDGVGSLEGLLSGIDGSRLSMLSAFGSPAENRQHGINYLLSEGYEQIIFADSDDVMSSDRVESSLNALHDVDIVVNDLTLIDESSDVLMRRVLSQRLRPGSRIEYEDLRYKNMMGLSNTAVRTRGISKLKLPEDLVAVDWYLFSCWLYKGLSARFIGESETMYRIHANNTAGFPSSAGGDVTKCLEVKCRHYRAMALIDPIAKVHYENCLRALSDIAERDAPKNYRKRSEIPLLWWEECMPEEAL